jgi:hypothetical protein
MAGAAAYRECIRTRYIKKKAAVDVWQARGC